MATRKQQATESPTRVSTEYAATIAEYSAAVKAMRKGDFSAALDGFEKVRAGTKNEPEMGDRATIYARICQRKLVPSPGEPVTRDDMYREAVVLMNAGDVDEALQLLTRALADNPTSVDLLYVRACAWALKGAAEKSVGDLRQAMAVDPKVRFQAVNDPDFERIREEPSFIDIIEPTPAGA